jgi:hypothetical protein
MNIAYNTFVGGEVTTRLLGRADIERFALSAETVENFMVRPQGPLSRRRGSLNVTPTAIPASAIFTTYAPRRATAQVLMFIEGWVKVVSEMPFIELHYIHNTSTPIPYLTAELPELQFVQSGNELYITHPNHRPARITEVSSVDWRYEYLELKNGPYMDQTATEQLTTLTLSSVTDRVTLTTDDAANFTGMTTDWWIEYPLGDRWVIGKYYSTTNSKEIVVDCVEERCFVPSTEVYCRGTVAVPDSLFAASAVVPPGAALNLTGNNAPLFSHSFVVTREVVGNYLRFSNREGTVFWMDVDRTVTFSSTSYGAVAEGEILYYKAPTGTVVRSSRSIQGILTSSTAAFFNLSRDIGRWYRLVVDGKVINAQVLYDAANTTTSVKVRMSDPVPVSKDNPERVVRRRGTAEWQKGSFYTNNYPATVALHEQRLAFGGTYIEPNTLWFSKAGDYVDFATRNYEGEVLDNSGINLTLASSTLNEIFWLSSRGSLMVGTAGAEWSITSASTREAITPTNVKAEQQSAFGSIYAQAVVAARSTMFIQGGGRKIRELLFDVQADGYVAADATIFSEHILRDHGGGISIAYQQLPDSRVYVVCGDGQVAVLTYEPDQKVYAWSRYILGGTNAVVNAVAVDQSGTENVLYLNVTRTVNGSPLTTLETLNVDFRPSSATDKTDMYFLDNYTVILPAALTGTPLRTIPSAHVCLPLYRGQTISLLIDDTPYEGFAVGASGDVVLPATPAVRAVLGYPYTSKLVTLPMDIPNKLGTSQAKTARVAQMAFRLLDSLYLEHGPSQRPLYPSTTATGNLFSGDIRVPYDQPHDRRPRVQVQTAKPLPLTILAVYPEVTQSQ